ncbi:molecular chaperone Hsp90, partial [Actinomycetospora atypica]
VVAADPDRGPAPAVLDRPWLVAALDPATLVPVAPGGAAVLADLLDLPLASERVHGEVRSPGTPTPWAALTAAVTWAAAAGRELPGGEVVVHERLRVAVAGDGDTREVFPGVWVQDDAVHTDDPVRALLAAWAR